MRCANLAVIISIKLAFVPREAKIAQLYCPVLVDQDVLTFQVTVEHLSIVEVAKGNGDLQRNTNDLFWFGLLFAHV